MFETTPEKPPVVVQAFAWILILGGIGSAIGIILSGGAFSPSRSAWNAVSKLIAAASGYGYLRLRRWGPVLYLAGYGLNILLFYWIWQPSETAVAQYSTPASVLIAAVVPAVVAILTGYYWKRFS